MALVNQSLTFGNVTSSDYNIYISGEGVFNAPKRRTKVVEIPGRNGDLAQDLGSYENINVTYPAFYKAPDLATFADDLEAFRAAIASQIGYQRLTDTIHPDQYRMGLFIEGLTVTPVKNNTLGEFDLIFNCKPQRWLTSGEAYTTSKNLTNPTRFNAAPIFEVQGYGTIAANGDTLATVNNNPIGDVELIKAFTVERSSLHSTNYTENKSFSASRLNRGDTITLDTTVFNYAIDTNGATIQSVAISDESGTANATITVSKGNSTANVAVNFTGVTIQLGTRETYTKTFTLTVTFNPGTQVWQKEITCTISYPVTPVRLVYVITAGASTGQITVTPTLSGGKVVGKSTKTVTDPLYIDMEQGVAWYEISGVKQSANNVVSFPVELGTLPPGANTIMASGTFTAFQVAPRWWTI